MLFIDKRSSYFILDVLDIFKSSAISDLGFLKKNVAIFQYGCLSPIVGSLKYVPFILTSLQLNFCSMAGHFINPVYYSKMLEHQCSSKGVITTPIMHHILDP